jgi:hypothetical protein
VLCIAQDDDTNYHMDVIAGLANMRARNYSIQEVRSRTGQLGWFKSIHIEQLWCTQAAQRTYTGRAVGVS